MFVRIRKEYLATAAASALLISTLSAPASAAPTAERQPRLASTSWLTSVGDFWELFADLRFVWFWEKSSSAYDPNGGTSEGEGATAPGQGEEVVGKSSSAYDPNG